MSRRRLIPFEDRPLIVSRYIGTDGRAAETQEQIANTYGVSRERIRQILAIYNITSKDSPRVVRDRDKRAAREIARLGRFMPGCGCTMGELETIRSESREAIRVYREFRHNVVTRKLPVELTLPQWWALWKASGKWAQRGRGHGYGIGRIDPRKGFTLDNVTITTGADQVRRLRAFMPEHFQRKEAA